MFLKLINFIIFNAIGFFSVAICFQLSVHLGLISPDISGLNQADFQSRFLSGTMIVWLCCAALSLFYFFILGKSKYVALLCPAIIPYIYGFSVLGGVF